jgi:hypothetical protein
MVLINSLQTKNKKWNWDEWHLSQKSRSRTISNREMIESHHSQGQLIEKLQNNPIKIQNNLRSSQNNPKMESKIGAESLLRLNVTWTETTLDALDEIFSKYSQFDGNIAMDYKNKFEIEPEFELKIDFGLEHYEVPKRPKSAPLQQKYSVKLTRNRPGTTLIHSWHNFVPTKVLIIFFYK